MTRYALLSHCGTENIGDDIQNLAAAAFLPQIDQRIPREALNRRGDQRGPVKLILNGWFMHCPQNWPPRPGLTALPISMHIARDYPAKLPGTLGIADLMLGRRGRSWLRQYGPVGARDRWTLELLQKRGIESYYSGCLTLTLRRRSPRREAREVIACDLAPTVLEALTHRLPRPPLVVTHAISADMPLDARTARAEALLDLYADAKLVVTSRLHCALPCLSLGVPVLFVAPASEQERYQPALDFAHHCSAASFIADKTDFDLRDPPDNPTRHEAIAIPLAERCRTFVAAPVLDGGERRPTLATIAQAAIRSFRRLS